MAASKTREPLRVGVIGAGWPGQRHAEGYLECDGVELVAVSDLDEQRRAEFARRYHVPRTYGDYHDMLADPDIVAVSVALPNFLHHPAVIASLEAGKHVLCEKPPAVTLQEAQEMEAAAERAGRLLAYGMQRRFNRTTEVLSARIASGDLGEIYHGRAVWTRTWGVPRGLDGWFTDPKKAGGGSLIDIGVHMLDWAWYLMGCPEPVTVSGQVYNKFPELTRTDDSAFGLIRFADGRSLQVEASWVLAQARDEMAVHLYGTRGGARIDNADLEVYKVSDEGRTIVGQTHWFGLATFHEQAKNFVAAIRGEAELRTTAHQGVQIMAMLEGIYRSAAQGSEVQIRV